MHFAWFPSARFRYIVAVIMSAADLPCPPERMQSDDGPPWAREAESIVRLLNYDVSQAVARVGIARHVLAMTHDRVRRSTRARDTNERKEQPVISQQQRAQRNVFRTSEHLISEDIQLQPSHTAEAGITAACKHTASGATCSRLGPLLLLDCPRRVGFLFCESLL